MKAMILAAGYGKRLRPLTNTTPKALLPAFGKPLIQYHLERLAAAGINDIVINTAWLGDKLENALADGRQFGVRINWSREGSPLETGGGIQRALPLLGSKPFMLINGDVWTNYPFAKLQHHELANNLAHLVLIPNPEYHSTGDFSLNEAGRVGLIKSGLKSLTYSGIALIDPQLITTLPDKREKFPLREALIAALMAGRVSGEIFQGEWSDVGTIERLKELQ
jgi:N-acetyl-alpha-D-muramate 1-phosphate uridylyltransferase